MSDIHKCCSAMLVHSSTPHPTIFLLNLAMLGRIIVGQFFTKAVF